MESFVNLFAVLDAQNQHIIIHDCKDDPVVAAGGKNYFDPRRLGKGHACLRQA